MSNADQFKHDRLIDTALHGVAIYNPAFWSRQELRDHFVARGDKLDRILDALRRERAGSLAQHRLLLGQRGMGKTTLLRRIAIGILDDAELAAQWIPLTFPEEQYNVANLADLWLNCLDALSDWLEEMGKEAEADALDQLIEQLPKRDAQAALDALLQQSELLERRFLLLIDNVDLVFDRLKEEHWALRDTLQAHAELAMFGASSRAVEASYQYDKAFYDFFKVEQLKPLSVEEMRATLTRLAELGKQPKVAELVKQDSARIKTLHTLTGGNPRTISLLYGVLANGLEGDVRSDLEGLLDRVTPLYKARFEELPEQSQRLLDALAVNWDPMTAKALSESLDWKVNLVSAQLNRLVQAGVVEKAPMQGKRAAFQIAERFFNIWYLMRTSRRVRRKLVWLARFLNMFFAAEELQNHARSLLRTNQVAGERDVEYQFAVAQAIEEPSLRGALETHALYSLVQNRDMRERMGQLLDFQNEDAGLKPIAERMQEILKLRESLNALLPSDIKADRRENLMLRSVAAKYCRVDKQLVEYISSQGIFSVDEYEEILDRALAKFESFFGPKLWLAMIDAISHGELLELSDVERTECVVERLGYPGFKVLSIWDSLHQADSAMTESDIRQMIDLEPTFIYAWVSLGVLLAGSGKYSEAKAACRQAIDLDPKLDIAWHILSLCMWSYADNLTEATSIIQQGISHCPESARLHNALAGILHRSGGELSHAVQAAEKAVAIEPNNTQYQATLALVRLDQEDWLNAESSISACLRMGTYEDQDWQLVLDLVKLVVSKGFTKHFFDLLGRADIKDRWRPLYEAIKALLQEEQGHLNYLDSLAPEIREPALEIVQLLRRPPTRLKADLS